MLWGRVLLGGIFHKVTLWGWGKRGCGGGSRWGLGSPCPGGVTNRAQHQGWGDPRRVLGLRVHSPSSLEGLCTRRHHGDIFVSFAHKFALVWPAQKLELKRFLLGKGACSFW